MGLYVGDLITKIRERTGQSDYSEDSTGAATEGISQREILEFINEAKDYIQTAIVSSGSTICDETEVINIVANQPEYQLTGPVHLGNKLRNVQYSFSGQIRDYRDLIQLRDEDELGQPTSNPRGYFRRGKKLVLTPPCSRTGAKLKVSYPRQWDDLSLRCGQITSSPGNGATSIVLDDDAYLINHFLSSAQFVCIVALDGEVKDYAVEVTSYNPGTRTLTIPSTDIVGVAGDFVVVGEYASSHLTFPTPLITSYVKTEAQMRVFDKEVSVEAIREEKFLKNRFGAILEGYQDENLDAIDIPIQDPFSLS